MREAAECRAEFRIRLPDGSVRWIRCRGRSYAGPKGAPERIMGAFLDITERKANRRSAYTSSWHLKLCWPTFRPCLSISPRTKWTARSKKRRSGFVKRSVWTAARWGRCPRKRPVSSYHTFVEGGGHCETILQVYIPEDFPWSDRMILGGKVICFARVDDLPPEAAKDKEAFHRHGQKSGVMFPLYAGGKVIGALAFGWMRKEREWRRPLLERLRLVAEVFANALARKRASEELQTAYSELRHQKEILQTIFDHIPVMIGFGDGKLRAPTGEPGVGTDAWMDTRRNPPGQTGHHEGNLS